MFKIIGCIAGAHDARLVLLAAAVCAFTVALTFYLYARLPAAGARGRSALLGVIGVVAGSGIWAVHFVAMLSFQPGLRSGYEPLITLASLLIPIPFSAFGFALAAPAADGSRRLLAGGALLGAGIALMHFTGMTALRIQARLAWEAGYVAAAVAVALLFAALALAVGKPGAPIRRQLAAAALLAVGICGLHFTAMSALTVTPDPLVLVPREIISRPILAMGVTGLAALIIAAALAVVAIDLRMRRRAFDTLREAIDAMSDGMVITDADNRLMVWNARYAEHIGKGSVPLKEGMPYRDLLNILADRMGMPDDDARAARIEQHLIDRRRPSADGRTFLYEGRHIRLHNNPTPRGGVVTVSVDVTDLKRNAEMLAVALSEADAASRAKTEFLANITHEIRTPLNGVLGMTQVITQGELSPVQRQRLAVVERSGEALLSILNDVLDVSRIEAGKLELDAGEIDAASLAATVKAAFAPLALEKSDVVLSVAMEPDACGPRRGDPARVNQILHILVSNAFKFTAKGQVRVTITGLGERRGDGLRLTVSDTGIGVPAEVLPRLFEKFTQADGSNTRRYGGAGLGLTIAKSLVELMDGQILVDSIPGEGSTFTVILPAPRVAVAKEQGEPASHAA